MSVIYLLLPLALVIVGVAVGAFIWAARRGQFDDLETPAMRIILEDDQAQEPVDKTASPKAERGGEPQTTDGTPTS